MNKDFDIPNGKHYKVYKYVSGPGSNPYIANCKSLVAAQRCIAQNAQYNPEYPHNIIWESQTVARAYCLGETYKPGTCAALYEIVID